MSVLTREISVSASMEEVRDLLTSLPRVSEFTEVRGVTGETPPKITVGTTWKNPGVTMRMPASDTTTVTDVSEIRIAWTTRSMLFGFIPSQMYWSHNLEGNNGGTKVINTLERVSMMGVPIGLLVKLPFLPFLYLARGTVDRRLQDLLIGGDPCAVRFATERMLTPDSSAYTAARSCTIWRMRPTRSRLVRTRRSRSAS